MQHILFPTDFSDNADHALPFALEMAKTFNAEITLFNSYKLPYSKSNLLVSMIDRMKEDSEKSLLALKEKILEEANFKSLKINTDSRSGGFVSLIPKIALSLNADLIVMGTKGASGLKEIVIGSNTLEVIQATRCPVLAIPENAVLQPIKKIALATDFRPIKNPEQFAPLFDVARRLNIPIEFVNVLRKEDEQAAESKAQQAIALEKMAHGIKTSIFFVSNDDIIDGIDEYMSNMKPGLFALLSRKHTLFERIFQKSITNKLSFRTEIPLIVIDE